MPPRKVRTDPKASDVDAQSSSDEGTRRPSPVLMSGDQLTSFLAAFANTQAEANRQLVESLMASHAAGGFAAPSPTPSTTTSKSGNMSKCTARFDGQNRDPEIVEAFIDSVEMYKECALVNDDLALRGLPMLLHGEAAVWWRGIRTEVSSWSEAVKRLRSMYGTPCPAHKLYRTIFANEQNEELADSFIVRIRGMIAKFPYVLPEEAKIDMIYGLLHKRIRKRLPRDTISSIESLIDKARDIEESITENSSASTSSQSAPTETTTPPARYALAGPRAPRANSAGNSATTPSLSGAEVQQSISRSQVRSVRNTRNEVQSADKNNTASESKLFCVYCKSRGHTRDLCPKKDSKVSSSNNKSSLICYGCGEKGFVRANCPTCKSNVSSLSCNDNSSNEPQPQPQHNVFYSLTTTQDCPNVSSTYTNNTITQDRPILNIEILGYSGSALIDTAARRSIAGSTLYALFLRLGIKFKSQTMSVRLADGSVRTNIVLLTCVDVNCMSLCIPVEFVVFPDASNNETLLGIDFITKSKLVLNFSSMTWYTADRPQVIHPLLTESSRELVECASLNLLRGDEGTLLTEEERGGLENLLGEYSDIFNKNGDPTPFAEHHIDTGDHPPIAVPPYRVTPAKKELIRIELDKMLDDGIIEECESAWAAPIVLVPKSNGGYRFCVDYRRLNAVTKTDAYPMPRIDELLQSTKKGCVMSSCDLRSGYWQCRVKDQDKTAFVTPFGTYRFLRMPFGLKNAPATFQRLIDRFRSGSSLKDVIVLTYLDDILVISESYARHLLDLRAVFNRLRLFKLRANRDKCVFAREKVKYLGHVISPEGISPDEEKVLAVVGMKEPTCLQQLRTFLQTCSWFRKFIPDFAKVAEPLTRLTKKSQAWVWSLEQGKSFETLKKLLTTAPILVQADYTKPFVLRTDASNYALGAALLQGESPNQEHPIEYASRLLTPAEQNYSTTEREALAVVWAVERFRGYIDGHQVNVMTDHQPLKWLFTLKSPSGRLVRWALKLQSFDLRIEYAPGKVNVLADTLSRPVTADGPASESVICPVVVDVPRWNSSSTRDAQLADPEVAKIIHDLEGNDELNINRWSERGYLLNQGVLYRYVPDTDSEEPQLVVPESLRKEIMFECHDSPTAAHGGIDRTIHRISQRFYFPGMRRFVTEYLKTCIECQRYKPSTLKPAGLLQTPVPSQRFETIATDLFGPLPKGPQGERWILIVEDTTSKWVEVFALTEATAETCAKTLVNEVFMRFGLPRRMISDNGVQFVADVMQKAMFVLGVKQSLVPLYHPEANPVERKNRDLKAQLAILVEGRHQAWPEVLPFVRFAFNSSVTKSTDHTPAYLTFGRELRSPLTAQADLRAVVESENFVPQITPYLLKLADTVSTAKETLERQQDVRKSYADKSRSSTHEYLEGDLVLMRTHTLSNAAKGVTSKFNPKRDGPYVVSKKVSPTTYLLAHDKTGEIFGKYHVSDLRPYHAREGECPEPIIPKRNRGRPRKVT